MKILGIAGSLRKDSYNKKLLRNALKQAEALGAETTTADLSEVPMYNKDVEDQGFPEPVKVFQQQVKEADLLIIAAPEYNHSISGPLKNAIDWATRGENFMDGKIAVVMGASSGQFGTARGQADVRKTLGVYAFIVPQPLVYITKAGKAFDEEGNLIDKKTVARVKELVEKGMDVAKKLKQ